MGIRLFIPNPFCVHSAPMMRTGALEEISGCSRDHFAVDSKRRGVAADGTPENCSVT